MLELTKALPQRSTALATAWTPSGPCSLAAASCLMSEASSDVRRCACAPAPTPPVRACRRLDRCHRGGQAGQSRPPRRSRGRLPRTVAALKALRWEWAKSSSTCHHPPTTDWFADRFIPLCNPGSGVARLGSPASSWTRLGAPRTKSSSRFGFRQSPSRHHAKA